MKIAIASDHAGAELKIKLIEYLNDLDFIENVDDLYGEVGKRCDYPIASFKVGEAVISGKVDFGILVCGSGIGVSIAANKVKGIRAVCAHDVTTARLSRQHNNCNVLTLGGRLTGFQTATDIIDTFLSAKFEGGRHEGRIKLMSDYEMKN